MTLRLFYACYYTAVGVSLPFLPPYLRGLGLTGRQIATLLAIAPVLHLGVPLAWGWLADRTRRPDLVLRLVCFGAFLCILPLVVVRTMPAMLFVFLAHQLFAVAVGGLSDALALERVRTRDDDYGRIRIWGSITFALTCAVVGEVLAARGARPADPLVPSLLAGALGLAALSTLTLRGHAAAPRPRPQLADVRLLLRDRRFLFLLTVAPLHWAFSAPYHGFFSILLQDRGLSPTVVGHAFLASVVAEIAAFFFFRRLRARFGLSPLLAVAAAGTVLRWLLVAAVHAPVPMVMVQLLHALTFGLFWVAAVAWLAECVPPQLRATGQTLFTAATFGVGNVLGVLGSGALYDAFAGAGPAFVVAGALEIVPLALVLTRGRRLDPTSAPAAGTRS